MIIACVKKSGKGFCLGFCHSENQERRVRKGNLPCVQRLCRCWDPTLQWRDSHSFYIWMRISSSIAHSSAAPPPCTDTYISMQAHKHNCQIGLRVKTSNYTSWCPFIFFSFFFFIHSFMYLHVQTKNMTSFIGVVQSLGLQSKSKYSCTHYITRYNVVQRRHIIHFLQHSILF